MLPPRGKLSSAEAFVVPRRFETLRNEAFYNYNVLESSLDVLRGSYLLARDSVVPHDVFLEGRTGFGHSSIFSDMQASDMTSLHIAEDG
ncbi:hypothetical protein O3M35_000436 [Rhynocoris fuscipes]|uniref:Uncharacterized protein n=1 Tax=Rhynocoris fuscipes TaxID=488301 RepID=A0AAW1DQ57_9HEMI